MRDFPKGRALVIGVGTYNDARWNAPTARRDAEGCFDALVDHNGAGYARNETDLLLDTQATREGFIKAFGKLADRCTTDTVVFISITCHGAKGDDALYYLATSDTQFTSEPEARIKSKTGFSIADLARALRSIPSHYVLVVINACFAGHLGEGLIRGQIGPESTVALPEEARVELLDTGEGRAIISASKPDQRSYFHADKEHSYFGQALINALKGGPESAHSGVVGLYELYTTIYRQVKSATIQGYHQQDPTLTLVQGVGPFPVAAYPHASGNNWNISQKLPADMAAQELPRIIFDQRLLGLDRASIQGDLTTGNLIGRDHNQQTYLTMINMIMNASGTADTEAMRERIERWLVAWAPHVETLKRLQPKCPYEVLLSASSHLKNPLQQLPLVRDTGALFRLIVDSLAYNLPQRGAHPLLVFIQLLVNNTITPLTDRAALQGWLVEAIQLCAIDQSTVEQSGHYLAKKVQVSLHTEPALLIALAPNDDSARPGQLQVRAWLWLGPDNVEPIHHPLLGSYTIEELEPKLREIYQVVRRSAPKFMSRLSIEFFLPRDLLSSAIHWWHVLSGSDEDEEIQLCSAHPVAVRSYERAFSIKYEEAFQRLREKWELLRRNGQDEPPHIYKLEQSEIPEYLYEDLLEPMVVGYAQVHPIPQGVDYTRRVLKRLIDAGLPMGMWPRIAPDLPATVYQELDTLAMPEHLAILCKKVRDLRIAAGKEIRRRRPAPPLGETVILMWDNPERMPPLDGLFISPTE